MFNFKTFDNWIFDMNKELYNSWSSDMSSLAETFEHLTGRQTTSSTKALIKTEIATLNALRLTDTGLLKLAMVLIPSDYQDSLANKLVGVKT